MAQIAQSQRADFSTGGENVRFVDLLPLIISWGLMIIPEWGGFRFKESVDADFINSSPILRIPPLTDIRVLEAASKELEQSEERNELSDK